jgi:hypothetical protein
MRVIQQKEGNMFVIRNVFRCKPGQAKAVAEKFKSAHDHMTDLVADSRVMVDEVGHFWTVVVEVTVDDMGAFTKALQERGSRDEVQKAMAGYMDQVESGYREIFRVV